MCTNLPRFKPPNGPCVRHSSFRYRMGMGETQKNKCEKDRPTVYVREYEGTKGLRLEDSSTLVGQGLG